ncbi:Six-bladed beta-propeller TolB-like protein [Macrophomina phaseolina MS6]|uniref:Six-bladed beta-propeller TolB-like protein n=1 Tax=Macrophomina phaseolina (strain MS6) TaxID=1126212 RepID=K2RXT0_MACPH|nr:Six-bladed beta-propeller TolB-like protein [Macrophomina phaseolina MS6]
MSPLSLYALVVVLLRCVSALPGSAPISSRSPGIRTVFEFANGTWVENLAVRRNGNLLVTLIDRPELYQVDPFNNTSILIHRFEDDDVVSLLGISEVSDDVFAIIAGNFSIENHSSEAKSYSIWQADFNQGGKCERTSEVEPIPQAEFLNGMTTLSYPNDTLLIADSGLGLVWRLNVRTREYEVVLEDETMKPVAGSIIALGINGIHVLGDYVYYVNAFQDLLCRVQIDTATGKAIGPYEIISRDVPGDDFTITPDGTSFVAENFENTVDKVYLNGTRQFVAGGQNSTLIPGPTSAAFGRTVSDRGTLYVTTAGGQGDPVNGYYTEGGKVVAIEIY